MYDFWNFHGVWFLIAMFFFPRLTMLFLTSTGGGFLYWLGWLLMPRLTVAIIATILFNEHNTLLLVFTWVWALGGEFGEKSVAKSTISK